MHFVVVLISAIIGVDSAVTLDECDMLPSTQEESTLMVKAPLQNKFA